MSTVEISITYYDFRPGKIGKFKNIMTRIHIVLDVRVTGLVNSWAAGAQGVSALAEKPPHHPNCSDGSWFATSQTSVSVCLNGYFYIATHRDPVLYLFVE